MMTRRSTCTRAGASATRTRACAPPGHATAPRTNSVRKPAATLRATGLVLMRDARAQSRSQDVRLSNRSLGAVPPFVMDKSDMRLLDLSNNKLTILPNLLVWRSEVASAFRVETRMLAAGCDAWGLHDQGGCRRGATRHVPRVTQ